MALDKSLKPQVMQLLCRAVNSCSWERGCSEQPSRHPRQRICIPRGPSAQVLLLRSRRFPRREGRHW